MAKKKEVEVLEAEQDFVLVDPNEQLRKDLFIALAPQINIDHPRAYTQKLVKAIDVIIETLNAK